MTLRRGRRDGCLRQRGQHSAHFADRIPVCVATSAEPIAGLRATLEDGRGARPVQAGTVFARRESDRMEMGR